jgi:hypothetical protein
MQTPSLSHLHVQCRPCSVGHTADDGTHRCALQYRYLNNTDIMLQAHAAARKPRTITVSWTFHGAHPAPSAASAPRLV